MRCQTLMGTLLRTDALYCIKFRNHDGFITKKEMAQVAKRLSQNQVRIWALQVRNKTKSTQKISKNPTICRDLVFCEIHGYGGCDFYRPNPHKNKSLFNTDLYRPCHYKYWFNFNCFFLFHQFILLYYNPVYLTRL